MMRGFLTDVLVWFGGLVVLLAVALLVVGVALSFSDNADPSAQGSGLLRW